MLLFFMLDIEQTSDLHLSLLNYGMLLLKHDISWELFNRKWGVKKVLLESDGRLTRVMQMYRETSPCIWSPRIYHRFTEAKMWNNMNTCDVPSDNLREDFAMVKVGKNWGPQRTNWTETLLADETK